MSYLGRSAKLSRKTQEKVSFLATAGQTNKAGLSYVPTFVEVTVNGILLTDVTDYTATSGSSITFTVALGLNDEVTVVSLKTFALANHYNRAEADAAFEPIDSAYTKAEGDARYEPIDSAYTKAEADANLAAMVDSAPAALNTLNELAAALGDDVNFSTTVNNSIATKLPKSGGAMTGNITNFTSTGIDDNATSTMVTIANNQITLATNVVANAVLLGNNQALTMGNEGQLDIYFDGTDGRLVGSGGKLKIETGTGATEITGTTVELKNAVGGTKLATTSTGINVTGTVTADALTVDNLTIDGNDIACTNANGNISLTPNGVGNVEINSDTLTVIGVEGESASIALIADEADNNADVWKVTNNIGNTLTIGNQISGSIVDHITITPNATVANSTAAFAGKITAAGNVVVGATAVGGVSSGTKTYITSTGNLYVASSGEEAAYFNRNSNDGSIVEFRKNNAAVGSIGTASGSMYIQGNPATGKAGLTFYGSSIEPRDAGAASNGVVDLGATGSKFKDAYLSGGIHLGGTGAANKLDDYEEGTFTLTINGGSSEPGSLVTSTGYYTKVGRQVTISCNFSNKNMSGYSGTVNINGLPFSAVYGTTGNVIVYRLSTWTDQLACELSGSTGLVLLDIRSGSNWIYSTHTGNSTSYMYLNYTYQTS